MKEGMIRQETKYQSEAEEQGKRMSEHEDRIKSLMSQNQSLCEKNNVLEGKMDLAEARYVIFIDMYSETNKCCDVVYGWNRLLNLMVLN